MPQREENAGWPRQLLLGLGATTRHNALAYGYSLALTGAFGMLVEVRGAPHPSDILLFAFGAAVTFTILNAVTTRGYRRKAPEQPPIVRYLGSSLGFISVVGALGISWLLAWLLRGWVAWLTGGFAASTAYLCLSAFELALAQLLRPLLPVDRLEDR